jgi:hypothetical protein
MRFAASGAVALALVFGMLLYDMSSRYTAMSAQLGQGQQAIAQLDSQRLQDRTAIAQLASQHEQNQQQIAGMRDQLAEDKQAMAFIAAARSLQLRGPNQRASATMYMQPGDKHAVLVVAGMPRAEPGMTYQFWLAGSGGQEPAGTFDVDQNGVGLLMIDAPLPVNEYDEVMVTVERSGGSQLPSARVVLSASLHIASTGLARGRALAGRQPTANAD